MKSELPHIVLDRKNGVPLYQQICNALRAELGSREPGDPVLPPQRDLAAALGVSRNTVSAAYRELEREGLVVSRVGRGTEVVAKGRPKGKVGPDGDLRRTVEHAVEDALALGYGLDEFGEAVSDFLEEKRRMLDNIAMVFVECNREQLTYFSEHLQLGQSVVVRPLLLQDIRDRTPGALRALESADLVVTSFYHTDELERSLSESGVPLVGVNLQPEMSTIVSIARIPEPDVIGLVGASDQFLDEMAKTLDRVGVRGERIRRTTTQDPSELAAFLDEVEAVVVSPSRKAEVLDAAGGKPVVEFLFAPDETSVKHIRIALVDLKQTKKGGEDNARSDDGTDVP